VLAVDGRYPTFPGKDPHSTDGSRQICEVFDNVFLYTYPKDQVAKRNFCFDMACTYGLDFIVVLDSDSFIVDFDQREFESALERCHRLGFKYMSYKFFNGKRISWQFPLIYSTELRYYRLHNVLRHTCGFYSMVPFIPASIVL